jgi:hypothetical protein
MTAGRQGITHHQCPGTAPFVQVGILVIRSGTTFVKAERFGVATRALMSNLVDI